MPPPERASPLGAGVWESHNSRQEATAQALTEGVSNLTVYSEDPPTIGNWYKLDGG